MSYKVGHESLRRVVGTSLKMRREAHVFGVIAALFLLAVTTPPLLAATAQHVVIIEHMRFNPPQMTVAVGDRVEWKNEDIFSHTVTADDGSFDSGLIAPHNSWQTVLRRAGTIAYHCRPHPNMVAHIGVQGRGNPSPTQSNGSRHQRGSGALRWRVPNQPDELHPILVNFTAALLPLALLSDVLGRVFRRTTLSVTGFWLIVYAAAITPFTALAGWWWETKTTTAPDHAAVLAVHQWLGSAAVLLFIVLAVWRWRTYKRALPPTIKYLVFALLVCLALVYQGSLGGGMAFGH